MEDALVDVDGLDLTVHGYESVRAVSAFLAADPAGERSRGTTSCWLACIRRRFASTPPGRSERGTAGSADRLMNRKGWSAVTVAAALQLVMSCCGSARQPKVVVIFTSRSRCAVVLIEHRSNK